ncbi:MAG TPA: hypothetical protein VIL04_06705 [Solirubrobacterales bacterium]|jgi:hypothetical protein
MAGLRPIAIALVLVVAGALAPARAEVYKFPDRVVTAGGSFAPKRLPAKRMAPIALKVNYSIRMRDGSFPPTLERMVLDFDRDGRMDVRGLPRCREERIADVGRPGALRACRRALVGQGEVRVLVDGPDEDLPVKAQLLAFNAGRAGGARTVLLHARLALPEPTTVIAPVRITRAPGRPYRDRAEISFPQLADGVSLVGFKAKFERRWRHRGKRRSFVSARCSWGALQVRGALHWPGGDFARGLIIRTCRRR